MMNNEQENGLKGQYIIAQGKRRRSVALGWRNGNKIVRAITSIKEKILFRTMGMTLCFPEMMSYNSVRNNDIARINILARTVFLLHSLPRAAFLFVPHETLPWADIYSPFRAGKKQASTCV